MGIKKPPGKPKWLPRRSASIHHHTPCECSHLSASRMESKTRINHLKNNFNTFRKKIETKSIRICDIMSGESEKLLVALQRTANCDNDRHGSSKATNYDIMKNTNKDKD